MELSAQEIERRRENAQSLVAEGRLGGAEFGRLGGRPKKPRASEKVAEMVAGEADTFFNRLKEIVETGGESGAINAVRTLLEIEERERQITENEELRFEQLKRDELIKYLAGAFTELQDQGLFPGGIIDAEFEPVTYPEVERFSSGGSESTETG